MKQVILDIKAAILYLQYFQLQEEGHELDSPAMESTRNQLKIIGYPNPDKVPFDEDGIPHIGWASERFQEQVPELYEAIEYSPSFFDIT